MGERFLWMLEEIRREGVSMREVEKRAGLTPGEIGTYKGRFQKSADASIGAEKLAKICLAAGFSFLWVVLGSGGPRDENGVPVDGQVDDARREVADRLRGVYPDEVIDFMLATQIPVGASAEPSWWATHANYLYRSWETKTGPWAGTATTAKAKEG